MKLYKRMNGKDFEIDLPDALAKKMLEMHSEYFVKNAEHKDEPKDEQKEEPKEPARGRPRKG